eukprot:GCRY01002410.1.p1 GENE.GCRY01002410.1~~GCRY01002410.1.p1  ORF type:complete len:321 (-),score=-3.21 GCRY01002410.1:20-982(-)
MLISVPKYFFLLFFLCTLISVSVQEALVSTDCSHFQTLSAQKALKSLIYSQLKGSPESVLLESCPFHPHQNQFHRLEHYVDMINTRKFRCSICSKAFYNEYFLLKHLQRHHAELLVLNGTCFADFCFYLPCDNFPIEDARHALATLDGSEFDSTTAFQYTEEQMPVLHLKCLTDFQKCSQTTHTETEATLDRLSQEICGIQHFPGSSKQVHDGWSRFSLFVVISTLALFIGGIFLTIYVFYQKQFIDLRGIGRQTSAPQSAPSLISFTRLLQHHGGVSLRVYIAQLYVYMMYWLRSSGNSVMGWFIQRFCSQSARREKTL